MISRTEYNRRFKHKVKNYYFSYRMFNNKKFMYEGTVTNMTTAKAIARHMRDGIYSNPNYLYRYNVRLIRDKSEQFYGKIHIYIREK
jgi:hypothetical protein